MTGDYNDREGDAPHVDFQIKGFYSPKVVGVDHVVFPNDIHSTVQIPEALYAAQWQPNSAGFKFEISV